MCAGPPRTSLAVVGFSCLSHEAYQHACAHTAFPARATALLRIQASDVGLIYHVRLTPARSLMAGLSSACRCSDAVQKVFIATAWLRSQLRVRHSSGQQGRPSPSDLHQYFVRDLDHRPFGQYACANTLSPTDRGPIVVSCEARRRHNAAKRTFIEAAWLCLKLQSSSLNSYPLRRVAAHETRAELFRRRLPAGIARGTYDPFGRCLRKSLPVNKTRSLRAGSTGERFPRMCHGSATSASAIRALQELPEVWRPADAVDWH